ncbi:MAG: nucleotidyl transferase AbiEii/AbiGii toxin family protein [Breznakibacter sp.]|nr:nucleotidyl transferase AbiEii/AbiGii toxin family protein [Breznakibacter sp.]
MSKHNIDAWLALNDTTRENIFRQVALQKKLPNQAIEKDWWIVQTLSALFNLTCSPFLIFKGGTSLSKGWNLIQRFSEDIDLVIDRESLGFSGDLDTRGIKNLRKATKKYIVETLLPELHAKFVELGLEVVVKPRHFESSGQDPMIIELFYPKLFELNDYLKPDLLIEIGSRSLFEPNTLTTFKSFVADVYSESPFADEPITVPTANIERTFLEKIFLLHEEFQKPASKIRVERMSRHLYDIEKLMHTAEAMEVIINHDLYNAIVRHRQKYTPLQEVDYAKHAPSTIQFVPPQQQLDAWESDYKLMQEYMIYGNSLSFAKLIENLNSLQNRINNLNVKL